MKGKEDKSKILQFKEQLWPGRLYRFVRLDDEIGLELILGVNAPRREHKNLAISTGLARGRSAIGLPIVSDSGYLIARNDQVEITIDFGDSTQTEAVNGYQFIRQDAETEFDTKRREVRYETARLLSNRLNIPVIANFLPVIPGAPMEVKQFEPEST